MKHERPREGKGEAKVQRAGRSIHAWIAGRQTEVGRDGSGRGSSQRGTAQLGQPDCQLLGDYSKKKPATG